MKHIKLLTPAILGLSTIGITLPLASCANTNANEHISLSIGSDKTKSMEADAIVNYVFVLDKDNYSEKDFSISLSGDHTSDLTVKPTISSNLLILSIGCSEPYDTDAKYEFAIEFKTNEWTQKIDGFTLNVNGTQQSEEVDEINEVLKTFDKQSTMSGLISKLEENLIFFEDLTVTKSTYQWVWDSEQNVIFVMNEKGKAAIAPKGYKLNENKNNIWKMVAGNKQKALLHSSSNDEFEPQKDVFDSTTQYSQYLRSDEVFTTDLTFCSGLDTGEHEKLNLTFKKELSASSQPVVINTMKSSLTIEGSLNDIEHHGNLSELKVDSIDSSKSYNEYGSVDSVITLKSGTINLEQGADVNSIVVTATDASDVNINVNAADSVGTISATSEEVAHDLEDVVTIDPEIPEEKQPTIEPDPVVEPSEENEFYSGEGTAKSPWTIKTKTQLDNFAKRVKNQAYPTGQTNFYFNLMCDIDYENGNWTPVGTQDKPFKGIFNGCGFTIKNINYVPVSGGGKYDNHVGFFANTQGVKNDAYGVTQEESEQGITCQDKVWNKETNELIETNITEDKYSTVIKYLNIENVNAVDSNKYFVGAVAGIAENTYFYQCNVKSGTIHGQKHVGGLVGTCGGCIFKECTVGDTTGQLNIIADVYNVGGLAGSTGYDNTAYLELPWSCFAFVNCYTGNNCTISTNAAENGGSIGGLAGDNQVARSCIYVGCINNANINVTSKDTSSYASHVGGIAGFGQNVGVIANCINNGDITITNGSYCGSVGGMSADPNPNIFYKDINYGNITGYVVNGMAGITAIVGDGMPTFTDCENNGSLNNSGPGTVGDIYC